MPWNLVTGIQVATREDDEPEPSKPLEPFRDGYQAFVHARRALATAKVRCNSDTSGLPWGAQRRWKRQNSCRGCHSRRDIRHIPCSVGSRFLSPMLHASMM